MIRQNILGVIFICTAMVYLPATADTIVLNDGRTISGTVKKTDTGYEIIRAGGIVQKLGLDQVAKWEKDEVAPGPGSKATSTNPKSPTTPTPPSAPARGVPKVDPVAVTETATRYIHQGVAAMNAGVVEAALENFLDARLLLEKNGVRINPNDPGHFSMLEGGGTAYVYLHLYPKANSFLDLAHDSTLKDRPMVYNHAVLDFVQKTRALHGIKDLSEYLARHPGSDEPMLNLLGASLANVMFDGKSYKLRVFTDAAETYDRKNKELEQTRPGERHWGTDWMSKKEFDKIQGEVDDATSQLNAASAWEKKKAADWTAATDKYNYQRSLLIMNKGSVAAVNAADAEVGRCLGRWNDAIAARTEKWKDIPRPTWPKTFDAVMPKFEALAVKPPEVKPPEVKPDVKPGAEVARAEQKPNTLLIGPVQPGEIPPARRELNKNLESRDVIRYAVAIPIATDTLVTVAAPLAGATEVQLETPNGDVFKAEVSRVDANLGLAVLKAPGQKLAYLNLAANFTGGELTAFGYPDVSVFNPTVGQIAGHAGPPKSVGWVVSLPRHPRLAGTAIVDKAGALAGITTGDRDSAPATLPAIGLDQLRVFLGSDAAKIPFPGGGGAAVLQMTASR